MKIFAYVGSHRERSSMCYLVVHHLIDQIARSANEEVTYIIRSPENSNIQECCGCCKCFLTGICPLDDDMPKIKQEMLDSSLVILASPVYFANVSGCFKTFVDRISSWSHHFGLAGKASVSVAVASNNNIPPVQSYVTRFLLAMGTSVLAEIPVMETGLHTTSLCSQLEENAHKIVAHVAEKDFPLSPFHDLKFSTIKEQVKRHDLSQHEIDCCITSGLLNYNTFHDFFYSHL